MGFSAGRLRCLGGILHMLLDFANIACLLPGLAGRGCVKIGIFKTSLNLNRSLDFGEIARLCHAACFWPSRRRSGLRRGVARSKMRTEAGKMPGSLIFSIRNGHGVSDDRFGLNRIDRIRMQSAMGTVSISEVWRFSCKAAPFIAGWNGWCRCLARQQEELLRKVISRAQMLSGVCAFVHDSYAE